MIELTVVARVVYGRTVFYPECSVALAYADALGTKTLTARALYHAHRMGLTVVIDGPATLAGVLAECGQ